MIELWVAAALAALAAPSAVAAVGLRADRDVLDRLGADATARRSSLGVAMLERVGSARPVRRVARSQRLAELLVDAGSGRTVQRVAGEKVTLGAVAAVLGLVSSMPLVAPVLAAAAAKLPELRLRRIALARRRRCEAELPLLLDLLAAASSAGLTGPLALRAALDVVEGPLAEELARALSAVDLGARWRDELVRVGARSGSIELRRAIGVITRSDALGTGLGEQLTTIAADTREARRAAVTERARKAPVKMLFPLVFLVLPAFLLLTVVPVLVTTLRSIR